MIIAGLTYRRGGVMARNMLETFDDIRGDIAARLGQAAADRRSPLHTPVVATADADARVMVLRAFDADAWTLRFHTDVRSPKCHVIGAGSPVGVLGYDRDAKVQLRLRGRGRIETDTPLVQQAWEESSNYARRCYLGDGPGAPSDAPTSGLPEWAEGIQPTDEQVSPARENFAILLVELDSLDWFHLAHDGHVRAQFVRDGSSWAARWVAP